MKRWLTCALLFLPPAALMVIAVVTLKLAGAGVWEIAAIVSTASLTGFAVTEFRGGRRR